MANDSLNISSVNEPQFAPLIEPTPIEFIYETIGWYIIAAVIFIILIVLSIVWIRHYAKKKYRREAITEINQLRNSPNSNRILHCFVILKRVAIESYGRKSVANLEGSGWFTFLNAKTKSNLFDNSEEIIERAL